MYKSCFGFNMIKSKKQKVYDIKDLDFLMDPLTHEFITHPVRCGNRIYDKFSIEKWIVKNPVDPFTRGKINYTGKFVKQYLIILMCLEKVDDNKFIFHSPRGDIDFLFRLFPFIIAKKIPIVEYYVAPNKYKKINIVPNVFSLDAGSYIYYEYSDGVSPFVFPCEEIYLSVGNYIDLEQIMLTCPQTGKRIEKYKYTTSEDLFETLYSASDLKINDFVVIDDFKYDFVPLTETDNRWQVHLNNVVFRPVQSITVNDEYKFNLPPNETPVKMARFDVRDYTNCNRKYILSGFMNFKIENMILYEINFYMSVFENIIFENCLLVGCGFKNTTFKNTEFRYCRIIECELDFGKVRIKSCLVRNQNIYRYI